MTGASAFPDRLNSVDLEAGKLAGRPVLYLVGPGSVKAAAGKLLGAGAVVLLPPGPEPVAAPDWGAWMRAGLWLVMEADGVATLPGSGGSRAAGIACRVAHDLAIPVRTVPGWLTHLGQEKYMRRLSAGREAGP